MTDHLTIDLDTVDVTPEPEQAPGNTATEKQTAFIARLLSERAGVPEAEQIAEEGRDLWRAGNLTGGRDGTASQIIDRLLRVERPTAEPQVGPGIYFRDGLLVKVQESRDTGALYTKTWATDGTGWTYTGRKPLYGLTPDHAVTPEQAKRFGDVTGQCVMCGRRLTDERSISVGYGPVCAEQQGWPWGEATDDTAAAEAVLTTECDGCEESDGEPHRHRSDASPTV